MAKQARSKRARGTRRNSRGSAAELSNETKWTVMVFMGAASAGGEPLLEAAEDDIRELESVGSGPMIPEGQTKAIGTLNLFIQEHGRAPVPRRSHVFAPHAEFERVPGAAASPTGGHALEEFIRWSLKKAGHNPDNERHHSILVLWGHAYDFAFGREQAPSGEVDALDFAEIVDTLQRIRERIGYQDAKFDIIAFDSCDAATVEMACQLEPFARYLLASEIGIPIPGWPYDRILGRLRRPQGRVMGPPEFGAWTVRRFCESYAWDTPTSLTLLDLQRASLLRDHAELLAVTLARLMARTEDLSELAGAFQRSQTGDDRPFVDVVDLCLSLSRELADPLVRHAATALGNFLLGPRPPLAGASEPGSGNRFIVEHGRNGNATARLNGISLYAPHVATDRDFEAARLRYHSFVFARGTRWSEVVHSMARMMQIP